MDATRLQDRLYWGLNRAASILGQVTDAYRPVGATDPLCQINRYLQLHAAFSRVDGSFGQPIGYGIATCRGYFDASYTRVGDYLVQTNDMWFIAEQQSLLPVLCVKTNRIISITRQSTPVTATSGTTSNQSAMVDIISNWPASVLGTSTEGRPQTGLPGDTRIPNWIVLVPSVHGQFVKSGDIVTDDLGTSSIVVTAELSGLGWRMNVRQVTT